MEERTGSQRGEGTYPGLSKFTEELEAESSPSIPQAQFLVWGFLVLVLVFSLQHETSMPIYLIVSKDLTSLST